MKDPCSPSYDEIRDWAYGQDPCYPCEEWDIIVFDRIDDSVLNALVLQIAADSACPNQTAFLHFLNVMTGSVVRFAAQKGIARTEQDQLTALIEQGEKSPSPPVVAWAKQARAVLSDPHSFRYDDWYG